eukprot:jgi/Ulvmu1/10887/UM007_0063.1
MCTFETGPAIPVLASSNPAITSRSKLQKQFWLSSVEVDTSVVLRELSASPNPALRACIRECDYFVEWCYILVSAALHHTRKRYTGSSARNRWKKAAADKTVSATYVSAQEHFLESIGHQNNCDLQGALECLTKAHQLEGNSAQIITFASKQWTDHTYVPGTGREEVQRCNKRAIALAKAAQKVDSTYSLAWSAECISKGRLATFERNPKRILQLAKEAQEAAYKALEADSHDDIAHHLMGRWHVGMSSLNAVVRTLIKYVFGTEFRPGTMAQALECYQRAASLRPDRVIHRVELAKTFLEFAQEEDAIRELKAAFELPMEDINARQMLKEAAGILERLEPDTKYTKASVADKINVANSRPAYNLPEATALLGMEGLKLDV